MPNNTGLVNKTRFDPEFRGNENEICNTNNLVTKTSYNAKVTEIKNKIRDLTSLVIKLRKLKIKREIINIIGLVSIVLVTRIFKIINYFINYFKLLGTKIRNFINYFKLTGIYTEDVFLVYITQSPEVEYFKIK